MKVLYMGFIDIKNEGHIGVRKKIFGQIEAMKNNKMDVEYILHDGKKLMYYSENDSFKISTYRNSIDRRKNMLSKQVIDIIKKRNIDTIYIRYPLSDIIFLKFLKRIKKLNKKIYIEIPTYPYDKELKKISLIIDKLFRKGIKKHIDYIVTSSGRYESIYGVKVKFIDNCVSINDIKFKNHIYSKRKKEINLIAVAFLNNWHGYDRVIEGMKEYYNRESHDYNIKFKIVGIGREYENLHRLVKDYGLQDRVEFLGSKNGKELDDLFEISDIALGSLAIHRKKLEIVSSLKSREYCARGIPFIYAGKDPGFLDNEEFLMNIESNESYINMDKIINFYERLTDKIGISNTIREYSKKYFDWDYYYREL